VQNFQDTQNATPPFRVQREGIKTNQKNENENENENKRKRKKEKEKKNRNL